jgi:LysM repeat protein
MQKLKFLALTLMLLGGLTLGAIITAEPTFAQGENLLTNPSFEGAYSSYVPAGGHPDCPAGVCTTVQIPAGWMPWWAKDRPSDGNPEYKPATAPFAYRIRSGQTAAQYFSFYRTHKAGFFQQVTVPANANLRFTVYGQTWITDTDEGTSVDPVAANMRIGIDPTGGTNVFSPAIVWSGFRNPYDAYQLFSVEARAQGNQVTVFMFSAPDPNRHDSNYGLKHNDVYWDDAALVVIGAGSAAPAPPAGGGTTNPAPAAPAASPIQPTATPDADGVIYHLVQSGDSMWSIAARAGITLDDLLEYNNLSRESFIQAGQRLIIGFADPPEAEPEEVEEAEMMAMAAVGDEDEAEAEETPPTPEPTPAPTGGDICLMAYDDLNENGRRDAGEPLREAVAFTISDGNTVVSNYVTDGAAEPYCIQGLAASSYQITRSRQANEQLTTPGDWAIALTDGAVVTLEFGSVMAAEVAMVAAVADETELEEAASAAEADTSALTAAAIVDGSQEDRSWPGVLLIGAVALAALLLIGVLAIILSARRSAA